jgi:hypothetical protein
MINEDKILIRKLGIDTLLTYLSSPVAFVRDKLGGSPKPEALLEAMNEWHDWAQSRAAFILKELDKHENQNT